MAGEIPDNIWKFFEDECDGDTNTYLEKLEDGNKLNNDASNLRWVAPKENSANPITHQRQKDNMKASWTDERRKAMSDRTKGIPKTEEHKRKIAESIRAWHNRNKTNH